MSLQYGLTFEQYRALAGMSISSLKVLLESPLKFHYRQSTPRPTSAAQQLGTATHAAILEPETLSQKVVTWDGGTRRGKDWEAFKAENSDRLILTASEMDDVLGMRDSLRGFPPADKYLAMGQAEVSMQWRDAEVGTACRGRLDWLTRITGPVIADVKSTKSVDPRRFAADVVRLGYHLQLAYYCDGFQAITGDFPEMVILAVESSAPYEPAVFTIPDEVILQGRAEYRRLLQVYEECCESGRWPAALTEATPLNLPSWAFDGSDDSIDFGDIA